MSAPRPLTLGAAAVSIFSLIGIAWAIDVQVISVRASAHGPSDAQLLSMRPRLRRLIGYRSFQIVRQERRRCDWQARQAFKIPGGRLMHVVPKGMRDQAVVLQVKLVDYAGAPRPGGQELVDTDVRLQNRGVMLFGVDEDAEDSSALIIMLRAEE
jgi:hypothetical protein